MKKLFTNLFLLTFSLCYSQNWAPINSIEKFNYQIDTASYISNTLWIDSVKIIGSDSVFYLNKIVLDCFDCPWTFDPLIEFKIANQGQFLQERIIKKEPDVYRFEGKRTFTLKTHFALNESWTFDSTGNVVATVVDIFEDEIFGETDSLKTIQLSNGAKVRYLGIDAPDKGEQLAIRGKADKLPLRHISGCGVSGNALQHACAKKKRGELPDV